MDNESWAKQDFGNAPLGDKRLSSRLVEVADGKAKKPGISYDGVAEGDWAKIKAYYRLIDNLNDSAIDMDNILLPHRKRTIQRMMGQSTVLCIQDGTNLNYNNLCKCEGHGIIGKNQTEAKSRGLHLQSMLAITPEEFPLGVLRAECSDPEPKAEDNKRKSRDIPIEEKKTFSWIEGVRDYMELKAQMLDTKLINVLDREADFFELFDDQRNNCSKVDLLERAQHNRSTTGLNRLFETVKQSPVKIKSEIKVPRKSSRPKKSKQKAQLGRPSCLA